ncbi:phosphatase [Mesorhizobium sp. M8A.F.Ca.ET.207.01.1.1]|uniref:metallophosphoesterase n=1 Tax=Mesorhizobium sp. M8A.F.Ca.ET.207.01.1.1 TaxID=2563968 RepID=UPI00109D5C01|nr:metallophosphoesterase [Mesorhizobium sp. M8A.F.Ca.ET.207.01.1.1]TGQ83700.1 phosphatase [Mesorhizobium sp. M8A.F.Ca.ET.207.01.1.1]
MNLWIISDLHLEFEDKHLDIPDADVAVVAGDVTTGLANSIHWLGRTIAPSMPVVCVAGNHEYYGHTVLEGTEWGRVAAEEYPDVHFLENEAVVIGGVRFIGCTLWTDFLADGPNRDWAMAVAEGQINDYRGAIAWRRLPEYEKFTPRDALRLHERSRGYLERSLALLDDPTVVVTHHAPHPGSIHPRFLRSGLNAAFASDLSEVIEAGRPRLWVHGHVHDCFDYTVGETRIVCNPKGYYNENSAFDPGLIVEI